MAAKELKESVQDDILAALADSFRLTVNEMPVGKFQGSPEYDEELDKQINRIGKLFNYESNYLG